MPCGRFPELRNEEVGQDWVNIYSDWGSVADYRWGEATMFRDEWRRRLDDIPSNDEGAKAGGRSDENYGEGEPYSFGWCRLGELYPEQENRQDDPTEH